MVGAGPYYCLAGNTYVLQENISTPGTALVMSGTGITIDLNGKTVTFGTTIHTYRIGIAVTPGDISAEAFWASTDVTVYRYGNSALIKNGTIIQGSASQYCYGIAHTHAWNLTIQNVNITMIGGDSKHILMYAGTTVSISGGTLTDNRPYISDRFNGNPCIDHFSSNGDFLVEVSGVTIVNAKHWGIRLAQEAATLTSAVQALVHGNTISMDQIAVNGYAIGLHRNGMRAYGNTITGNGLGIDVEGNDCEVDTNSIDVINTGVDGQEISHGIKLESSGETHHCLRAHVHHNTVSVKAQKLIAGIGTGKVGCAALSLSQFANTNANIHDNTFRAEHLGGLDVTITDYIHQYVTAVDFRQQYEAVANIGLTFQNNLCQSNSFLLAVSENHSYHESGTTPYFPVNFNPLITGNTWQRFTTGVTTPAKNVKFSECGFDVLNIDNSTYIGTAADMSDMAVDWPWQQCGWAERFSGAVTVLAGATPVAFTPVVLKDKNGTVVATVVTNASGVATFAGAQSPVKYRATCGGNTVDGTRDYLKTTLTPYTVQATAVAGAPVATIALTPSWTQTLNTTADTVPPSAVVLAVTGVTSTTITLGWTAPGDDGATGRATAYEIRRSVLPITPANFAAATLVSGPPTPAAAGTAETMTVTGLQPGATWYFALRSSDEVPNWSTVSNSPSGTTTPPPADITAPGRITDLAVTTLNTSSITVGWTAPGDDLGVGQAAFYELGFSNTPMVLDQALPITTNGSLMGSHTPIVTGAFIQDIGSGSPSYAATTALAALDKPMMHFIPPCTAAYAACLSAICGAVYQLTAQGGGANQWVNPQIIAGAPDGAFGAPTAAAVINGNLISRTFARATVYANLSTSASVVCAPAPGGTLPALGSYIAQGTGYGTTNTDGMFPQRGGIFWGQTTAPNIAQLAYWKTWVGNNSQTEGPLDGVNSATPVADWRAARAAAVPTNPTGTFLESHNGLGVFASPAGGPSNYWPSQRRIFAYCELAPTTRWIQEGGAPLHIITNTPNGPISNRLFDIRDDALQAFLADEFLASAARCGADGVFGDEWHAIHPNRGALHPGVPQDVDQTAGMVRMCEITNSTFGMNSEVLSQEPKVAGQAESYTIMFLTPSQTYWVAVRATDEAGNVSLLSNQVSAMTDDLGPPSDISDLSVVSASPTTVTLEWSAPEDALTLGDYGPAFAYDLRRSTSPINAGNFAAATPVTPVVDPTAPGITQSVVVSGLASSTLYYFAMKSTDFRGNYSGISNVVSVATAAAPDTVGPSAISDLAVSIPTVNSLRLTWTAPGDDAGVGTAAAYDIRYSASPITALNFATRAAVASPPTPGPAGTAEVKIAGSLSSGTTYYFAIKAVDEVGNWSAISNLPSGATASTADVTAPSTISNLATTNLTSSSVTLTWTAPGDDAAVGTATSYDIRYSTSVINSGNFAAATAVSSPPAPLVAGTAQSKIVTGLTASTLYYFAIKAADEAGNVATISNVPSATTTGVVDVIAPDAVVNLAVASVTQTTATLSWTAPGDDAAAGTALTYDIRYSTATITSGNWAAATQVTGEPTPTVAGSTQAMVVTGLTAGTLYYFAMKTLDEVPNTSGLSNVASGTTSPAPDTVAPDAIANLAAPIGLRTYSSITLQWTSPGDDAASGIATAYDVRLSEAEITSGNFLAALSVSGPPLPATAGTAQTMTISGLVAGTFYWFAIKTVDEAGNWSAISNIISRATAPAPVDATPPATVTDLAVEGFDSDSIVIGFTAQGDDGIIGTATAYDVRYSTTYITAYTFAGASQVADAPAPQPFGARETVLITGLTQGTTYYIAVRVLDEIGNGSGISNVVSVKTLNALRYQKDVYTTLVVRKEVSV
jgi:chitodextrinase